MFNIERCRQRMAQFDCYQRSIRDLINEYGLEQVRMFWPAMTDAKEIRRNLDRVYAQIDPTRQSDVFNQ